VAETPASMAGVSFQPCRHLLHSAQPGPAQRPLPVADRADARRGLRWQPWSRRHAV